MSNNAACDSDMSHNAACGNDMSHNAACDSDMSHNAACGMTRVIVLLLMTSSVKVLFVTMP